MGNVQIDETDIKIHEKIGTRQEEDTRSRDIQEQDYNIEVKAMKRDSDKLIMITH